MSAVKLPTAEGAVIHITRRYGNSVTDWTAVLTRGGWHIAPDKTVVWETDELAVQLARDGNEFKVLYEPPEPLPTETGVYVPANNVNVVTSSYIYRRNTLGWNYTDGEQWHTGEKAEAQAKRAHNQLGGLVQLKPANA